MINFFNNSHRLVNGFSTVGHITADILTLSLGIALLLQGAAIAQDVMPAEELVRQLEMKPESEIRTRDITTRGITINSTLAASGVQGKVSFNSIQFEHDSARLTVDSTQQLVELGKALSNDRLLSESFVVEGHADAHGDEQYNRELSLRRAITVVDFLSANAGIANQRLQAVGKGEEEPQTNDPYDPQNRRVDVLNSKVYE
jgi:outer membrane protein OmpA-like peptidoglycan-associated protein